MADLFMGVEIGATKQQLALGDVDGNLLHVWSDKIPLPNGAGDVLDYIVQKMPAVTAKAAELNGTVRAAGVGFGGILESETGRILISVQVKGWQDFMLKSWFTEKFGLPVRIVNDTVCGGYGELLRGTGRDSRIFFYSNIGSGIGGALFIGGGNYDGQGRGAAYIGHTYIPDWTAKEPGKKEKTENICCGWAIERRLRSAGYVPKDSALTELCGGDASKLDCGMLGQAARRGDAFALSEIDRVAYSYSIALSNLITLLSPDTVAIGGGVANLGDLLIKPIAAYTNELAFISTQDSFRVVQCRNMDSAVLVGAVLYARDEYAKARLNGASPQ
jgi:glucokinase